MHWEPEYVHFGWNINSQGEGEQEAREVAGPGPVPAQRTWGHPKGTREPERHLSRGVVASGLWFGTNSPCCRVREGMEMVRLGCWHPESGTGSGCSVAVPWGRKGEWRWERRPSGG